MEPMPAAFRNFAATTVPVTRTIFGRGESSAQPMPRQFVALLHIGYWMMYTVLLLFMFRIIRTPANPPVLTMLFTSRVGFLMFAPNIAAFYLEYALLVPRFLATKRFALLAATSVGGAIASAVLFTVLLALAIGESRTMFSSAAGVGGFMIWLTVLALIHMTIAMVMRGFINWYDDIGLKQELTRKTVEVESALLRAKLDPHFLFNTLNNIDVLVTQNAAAASQYLLQLSEILRFVLYEARAERVALEAELAYFEKYIALQRIRIANPLFVSFALTGTTSKLSIAPMLLIPFIENAFKHAAGQRADASIVISIDVTDATLTFACTNRYQRGSIDLAHAGGIGRDLIERRLELLYPKAHTRGISDDGERYAVHLTLNLDDRALHNR
jgi:two-component system LytT family sensor kinase